MVMEDGCATNLKLESSFMHPVSTCCTRITNIFKHGQYSNQTNAFIQHGRFDLLLENSWYRVMYCKIFKVDSNWLKQDTHVPIWLIIVKLGTSLHFILNILSTKTYSRSNQDSQAIQAWNCKFIRFKSVRWHDEGSSKHTQCISWRSVIMPSNLYV